MVRRMSPLALPCLAVLAASSSSRMAVVDLAAPDEMLALAGQVTRTVVAEAQRQGRAVSGPDEVKAALGPKRYEALRACAGKPACVSLAVEGAGYSRVLAGRLGRDEKNYLLELWLVDPETLRVVASVDRAILIAARRLQKDLDEAVPRLLREEPEAMGTLRIESTVARVEVSVNGEPAGTTPVTRSLKPGKYEVRLERTKYLPVTRLVEVEAGQTSTERIPLLLKPGEVPDEELGGLAKKADDGGGGVHLTAPTWVALGVTVLAGGAAAYCGLTARAQERELVAGYDAMAQTYQGTRAQALLLQQNALMANVAFAVAGVGLVASVVLILRDASRPTELALAPLVAPGGGGLALGGRLP